MTRTINQIFEAIENLKKANLKLSDVIIGHLDDGQNGILADSMENISTAIKELSEVEHELRHGETWVEPNTV